MPSVGHRTSQRLGSISFPPARPTACQAMAQHRASKGRKSQYRQAVVPLVGHCAVSHRLGSISLPPSLPAVRQAMAQHRISKGRMSQHRQSTVPPVGHCTVSQRLGSISFPPSLPTACQAMAQHRVSKGRKPQYRQSVVPPVGRCTVSRQVCPSAGRGHRSAEEAARGANGAQRSVQSQAVANLVAGTLRKVSGNRPCATALPPWGPTPQVSCARWPP